MPVGPLIRGRDPPSAGGMPYFEACRRNDYDTGTALGQSSFDDIVGGGVVQIKFGRTQLKLGRSLLGFGRNQARFGRTPHLDLDYMSPTLVEFGPDLFQPSPSFVEPDSPIRSESAQFWSNAAQVWPISAQHVCRSNALVGSHPNLVELDSNLTQTWSTFGRDQPILGVSKIGSNGRSQAILWRTRTKLGRNRPGTANPSLEPPFSAETSVRRTSGRPWMISRTGIP